MKRILITAVLILAAAAANADTIKATVGHMCCGSCKAAAMGGVKTIAWADSTTIDGTTLTVTSKPGMSVDVVSLVNALNKCGFPPKEINVGGPVTMAIAHLCCGQCASDLKTNMAAIRSQVLDKDNVKIDQATKTVTVRPLEGKQLNLVSLLRQMQQTGFSASSCTVTATAVSRK